MKKQKKFVFLNAINDAMRKQFFTNYNLDLMNEIRRIKLNEIQCSTNAQKSLN